MKPVINFFFALLMFCPAIVNAQNRGKILLITDADADVIVDGDKQGSTTAGNAFKLELSAGEHYVQVQTVQNGKTVNVGETAVVEADKQKILHLNLANASPGSVGKAANPSGDTMSIASVDFMITGAIEVGSWLSDHPNETYPNYPKYFYVLDKGDQLIIDFRMDNKKGTNTIKVASYPDGNVLYSDNNLVAAKNLSIKIPAKGIYQISYETNHVIDRSCNMRVRKIPASDESKSLNPAVVWKTVNDTVFKTETKKVLVSENRKAVSLQQPSKQWVNSGRNALFQGGKSRIIIPVDLPENTVEWYYIVSADRNEASIDRTLSGFKLLADVSKAIDQTGLTGFAINMLTKPPGANYCDTYLLDYDNQSLFTDKTEYKCILEGTRENIVSGLVNVKSCTKGNWYIGVKNPDSGYGEFVAIEVVAITKESKYETRQVKTPLKITTKKVPVIPG